MAIGVCPTFWLDKPQTDRLKALARAGGDGAIELLRGTQPAPRPGQYEDLSLKLYFSAGGDPSGGPDTMVVTLLIVNLGAEPLLLSEPPADPWGQLRYAPVVMNRLDAFDKPRGSDRVGDPLPSGFVKQESYSWDKHSEWVQFWIDPAPIDALGAGSSSVGVFQIVKDYGMYSGAGGAVKLSSSGRFDHCYIGGEYNYNSVKNCGAIGMKDCGTARDFFDKFVAGAERYTDTDASGSGAYCACSSINGPFNCITAVIP